MRVINVVEIIKGIVTNIESFVLTDDAELSPKKARVTITKAKEFFKKKAEEHGCEDLEGSLHNQQWDNLNGYEILIKESENVHTHGTARSKKGVH